MSATITADPGVVDFSGTARVPFARLVKVELRKMFDTRAGLWLGMITGLLIVLTMVITLLVVALNDGVEITATDFSTIMTIPVSLLFPVLAIAIVTSEWGQRTSLVTFTLETHRGRVIRAKLVTVVILAAATIAIAIVAGAIGNLVAAGITGADVVWDIKPGLFAWVLFSQLLYFLMAFAFGMVFLNSPGAISVYYIVALLLPLMVYGTLYAIFEWARDLIPWIDLQYAMTPFLNGESTEGMDWVRVAFTSFVWVVVPVAIGVRRVLRAEVK
jgi:ABC-type transport system involved in multi-copper enzyme maturation permease subunit